MSQIDATSKSEISIPYRNRLARVFLYLLLLTAPVWFFVSALGLVVGVITLIFAQSIQSLITSLFLLGLLSIGLFLTMAYSDDKVFLCKSGISFPLYMLPWLAFKRSRGWTDLKAIYLENFSQHAKGVRGNLVLKFYSKGSAKLKLQSMSQENIEKLFLAIDVWAPQCLKNETATECYRLLTGNGSGNGGTQTYTQLWEEELRRRFFPTSFVPLEAGARLREDSLVIVRQMAFGGLSAIYLAQDKQKELVIVKESVVPINAADEAKVKALELFAREAKLLAKLKHDKISRVLDYFVEEGRQYLVLEQIKGQDTRQYIIEKGKQSEETVLNWAKQIGSILEFLHSQDPPIIHRDVTPDNLVLGADKNIFLIDFGASNEFIGTATGTLVGKQSYIAPEQFRGKATPQSDIYALGATLYYYLTGEEPEPLSTLSLPDDLAVSNKMRLIVSSCTAFKLEHRFRSASEFLWALSANSNAIEAKLLAPKAIGVQVDPEEILKQEQESDSAEGSISKNEAVVLSGAETGIET